MTPSRDDAEPTGGPTTPRWTHIAMRVRDIDATINFYSEYTPLEVLSRREDPEGFAAWMGHPEPSPNPFVLVLVQFYEGEQPWDDMPIAVMRPFNHLGFEMPTKADVDEVAARARVAGILDQEPIQLPDPVGYICMVNDPDGNLVEYSFGQKVYQTAQERWGTP